MNGAAEHLQVALPTSLAVSESARSDVVNTSPGFLEWCLLTSIALVWSSGMMHARGCRSSSVSQR